MTEKQPRKRSTDNTPKEVELVVETTQEQPVSYIHVDEFLNMAKTIYPGDIDNVTMQGFKAYVAPKTYFKDEQELKNKLDTYLGK